MTFFKSKKICIVYTIYAFLLYLINAKDDDIDKTRYIFHSTFPDGYEKRVKFGFRFKAPPISKLFFPFNTIMYRCYLLRHFPIILPWDEIFMQDHELWTQFYVWNHKYTFIEDSPCICRKMVEIADCELAKVFKKNLENKSWKESVANGPLFYNYFAQHQNAKTLLLTEDDPSEYLKDRKRIILPRLDNNLWSSFSDYKKQRILQLFDISSCDIKILQNAKYMLLTQCLYPDIVSQEDHKSIYQKIISKYDINEILIKTHPRDLFNYEAIWPGVKVFRKSIPIQIINMIGIKIQKAITVYSTSVCQLDCEVDWYGTEINDVLYKKVKHVPVPNIPNLNVCKL